MILLFLLWTAVTQPATGRISGIVTDTSGAAVAGALVQMTADGRSESARSGNDGTFSAATVPFGTIVVTVNAAGFAPGRESVVVSADRPAAALRIVLQPAALIETLTVSARAPRRQALDRPAVSVLTAADLWSSAPAALDDALRAVPGFQLFRRSSSRTSNPTIQGMSLRGLSASGASRALVLADNLPLNDPFGGWIYWNRVPQAAIDRVEVVRGAASDLHGADAVGGIVQIVTRDPRDRALRVSFDAGSHDSARVSTWVSGGTPGVGVALAGEWFTTDGFYIIEPRSRGAADAPAASRHETLTASVSANRWPGWRARAAGGVFSEDRKNGTRLQVNDTQTRTLSIELDSGRPAGVWSARGWYGSQRYDQTFSGLTDARNRETLSRYQRVPSEAFGVGADWAGNPGARSLLIGGDVRRVDATSLETPFVSGRALAQVATGGVAWTAGAFGQTEVVSSSRLKVVAGARGDVWKSDSRETSTNQTWGFFSPRASATWTATSSVSLRAAAYHGFRTPTLNELYRGFRVGDVVTIANPALKPEGVGGIEGGVAAIGPRAAIRCTVFWNELTDIVANVTLASTGPLTMRQRRNAGDLTAVGMEWETELALARSLRANAGASFVRSRMPDGRRPAQVPAAQIAGGLRYADPRWVTATLQIRYTGQQFEDDLNALDLRRATVVDLFAARNVTRRVNVFVAIENALDAEVDVGRTPLRTLGLPRSTRAGLRVFWP